MSSRLLFEASVPGRIGMRLPELSVPLTPPPAAKLRKELPLPEMDELGVVRHFMALSSLNYSVDRGFYPLGSCTMKYNPKLGDYAAELVGFRRIHPLESGLAQGALELMYSLQTALGELSGFPAVSLQGAAGAQAELAGVLMIKAYHNSRGEAGRRRILIPDSAHGTNPASCAMAGLIAQTLPSDESGGVSMDALKAACSHSEDFAGLMITNPNTLGLFERDIEEICALVHQAGGLVYGDGANMNALVGVVKPAEFGIDLMHLNLHKTFATPHGGGGPGAGALAAADFLADFLPGPIVAASSEGRELIMPRRSIGRLKSFYGNFSVLVRAYAYIRRLGRDGLRRVAEYAVLHANYLRFLLEDVFPVAYGSGRRSMHEFVVSAQLPNGARGLDVAKRLIDFGFHPPTMYFPLIVKEALMIEPTETESKESLEAFAAAMKVIVSEAEDPERVSELKNAPRGTPVGRLDETQAARKPILRYY